MSCIHAFDLEPFKTLLNIGSQLECKKPMQ